MRVNITHRMEEKGSLLLGGPDNAWIGVAGVRDSERRREINETATCCVPNARSACTTPDDGPGAVWFHKRYVSRLVRS